jgi:hypothetical protein
VRQRGVAYLATFDALDRLRAIAADRPGRPEHLSPVAETLRHPVTGAERAEIEAAWPA